jgi:hypothetical protein
MKTFWGTLIFLVLISSTPPTYAGEPHDAPDPTRPLTTAKDLLPEFLKTMEPGSQILRDFESMKRNVLYPVDKMTAEAELENFVDKYVQLYSDETPAKVYEGLASYFSDWAKRAAKNPATTSLTHQTLAKGASALAEMKAKPKAELELMLRKDENKGLVGNGGANGRLNPRQKEMIGSELLTRQAKDLFKKAGFTHEETEKAVLDLMKSNLSVDEKKRMLALPIVRQHPKTFMRLLELAKNPAEKAALTKAIFDPTSAAEKKEATLAKQLVVIPESQLEALPSALGGAVKGLKESVETAQKKFDPYESPQALAQIRDFMEANKDYKLNSTRQYRNLNIHNPLGIGDIHMALFIDGRTGRTMMIEGPQDEEDPLAWYEREIYSKDKDRVKAAVAHLRLAAPSDEASNGPLTTLDFSDYDYEHGKIRFKKAREALVKVNQSLFAAREVVWDASEKGIPPQITTVEEHRYVPIASAIAPGAYFLYHGPTSGPQLAQKAHEYPNYGVVLDPEKPELPFAGVAPSKQDPTKMFFVYGTRKGTRVIQEAGIGDWGQASILDEVQFENTVDLSRLHKP